MIMWRVPLPLPTPARRGGERRRRGGDAFRKARELTRLDQIVPREDRGAVGRTRRRSQVFSGGLDAVHYQHILEVIYGFRSNALADRR